MFFKSFLSVGGAALASRLLGFIRDLLMATLIGVSVKTDIFYIALQLPNSFRALLAEGALQNSAIPLLNRYKNQKDTKELLPSITMGLLMLMVTLSTFVIVPVEIFMPYIMHVLAPGYIHNKGLMTFGVWVARLMFPFLLLISMVTVLISLMNIFGKFLWSSANLLIFNLVFIGLLIYSYVDHWSLSHTLILLACGVIGIGVLQNIWVLLGIWYYKIPLKKPMVKGFIGPFFHKFLPNIFSGLVGQSGVFINSLIATFVLSGGVTYLYYSNRLYMFPVGIIGYATTTVIVPMMSQMLETKKQHYGLMNNSLLLVWLFVFPATIGLSVLSYDIVSAIIGYGRLNIVDQKIISSILSIQSLSLPAVLWSKVISSYLMVQLKVFLNLMFIILGLGLQVVIMLSLLPFFHLYAIPISSICSAWALLIILMYSALKKKWIVMQKQDMIAFTYIFIAGLFMLFMIAGIHWFVWPTVPHTMVLKIIKLMCEIGIGSAIYVGFIAMFFRKNYKKYWRPNN